VNGAASVPRDAIAVTVAQREVVLGIRTAAAGRFLVTLDGSRKALRDPLPEIEASAQLK
jgi:hypothetical protein